LPSRTERTRAERLADVYGRAGRIRRRRRLTRGGALVGSLALVVGFVVGTDLGEQEVDLVTGPVTSTTASGAADSASDTATASSSTTVLPDADPPAPTTTALPPPPPTVAEPPVESPTTSPPTAIECRNSYDPACGPFRYDPEPVNGPMTVDVSASPNTPSAGEEVVFTVTVNDDGPIYPDNCVNTQQYGDGTPSSVCTAACMPQPERFGPWDPPPPEPRTVTEEFRHVYERPGVYTAEFTYNAGADCSFSPYRSRGSGTVTIAAQ
jgi:hypothetical protein